MWVSGIIWCPGLMHVLSMAGLEVESMDDLKGRLKEMGRSHDAVKEILKLYKLDSSDKRA